MTKRNPTVSRVLVPADCVEREDHLRLTAAVLADWFEAELEIVTSTADNRDRYERIAAGVGVATLPIAVLDDEAFGTGSFLERLGAYAHVVGPAVCVVADVETGSALIRYSDQPVLVPGQRREAHRIATGPLVVPVSGHSSELDSLAVAATWARQLDLGIRLVAAPDVVEHDVPIDHEHRLRQMGLEAGVDRLTSSIIDSTLNVAITRKAAAIVVPEGWPDEGELLERAGQLGVSVLLSPAFDHQTLSEVFAIDFTNSGSLHSSVVRPGVISMSRAECHTRIGQHSVARVAYVDHGWPVAIPVNYTTVGSDVIIRSLPGGKLAAAERGDIVCLEIDDLDEADRSGWSVLVHGHLEVIAESSELRSAWAVDPDPWVAGTQFEWLRLTPLSMTGRRIEPDDEFPVFGHSVNTHRSVNAHRST